MFYKPIFIFSFINQTNRQPKLPPFNNTHFLQDLLLNYKVLSQLGNLHGTIVEQNEKVSLIIQLPKDSSELLAREKFRTAHVDGRNALDF